ncbi:MAG: aldo/keto reductase [Cyclobacteriaceae bacterium]
MDTPSLLGFGTYNFMGRQYLNNRYFGWPHMSNSLKEKLLYSALENGITFFDTSDFYGFGNTEKLIGKIISKNENLFIATKGGKVDYDPSSNSLIGNFSAQYIQHSIEASRKRLNIEQISLYQLHGPTLSQLKNQSLREVLNLAQNSGKIKHVGISPKRSGLLRDEYIQEICKNSLIKYVQMPLSFSQPHTMDVADKFIKSGKRIIARGIFDHGLLFKQNDFSDLEKTDPRILSYVDNKLKKRIQNYKAVIVDHANRLAQKRNEAVSIAQFLLLATISTNKCTSILFGGSQLNHIHKNLKVLSMKKLSESELLSFIKDCSHIKRP